MPRRDPYTFARPITKEYADSIEAGQEIREIEKAVSAGTVRTPVIVERLRALKKVRTAPREPHVPDRLYATQFEPVYVKPVDLIDDVDIEFVGASMAIVPISIEVIRNAAPWIVQQLVVQGLKALTVAELLEMISGKEFYSLDDVLAWVVNVLRGVGVGDFVGPPASGARDDPKDQKKGAVREGWYIKEITDYDYGKETSKKVWYKPYEDASRGKTGAVMSFRERCAYFQGKRVQAYDSRQAKYRAYKRGYNHGTGDMFQAQILMGHTRPCAPQLFYTKGRMSMGYGRRR